MALDEMGRIKLSKELVVNAGFSEEVLNMMEDDVLEHTHAQFRTFALNKKPESGVVGGNDSQYDLDGDDDWGAEDDDADEFADGAADDEPVGDEPVMSPTKVHNQMSEREWMRHAPRHVKEMVANHKRLDAERREQFVDIIMQQVNNEFTEQELAKMTTNQLEKTAKVAQRVQQPARKPVTNQRRVANYQGAAAPTNNSYNRQQQGNEPLIPPTLNFEEMAAGKDE